MISSLYFQYLSFIYLLLLMGIYFTKNRVNNIETNIYTKIIINCFIGVLLDIFSTYAAYVGVNYYLLMFLCKTYLFFLIFFGYYMGFYLIGSGVLMIATILLLIKYNPLRKEVQNEK